jgi:hypothetical protein
VCEFPFFFVEEEGETVRKEPEIPSTPPKQKRVILELTLLQSWVLHIPQKQKKKREGGIEYSKHQGSPALDLIQSIQQGLLLLHSPTHTLKTRTRKKKKKKRERRR